MSQQSQPVAIPAKESPRSQEEQASPVNSREASPSSSSGSKRKREEEEETQDVNDSEIHQTKKRKTPPFDSPLQASETPRVGQIQERVEKMRMNRMSGGPLDGDALQSLARTESADSERPRSPLKEREPVEEQQASPTVKERETDMEKQNQDDHEIETDTEETPAVVDAEMAQPPRRKVNGLKRIVNLDRPIEIDLEYNRKRKASEKLAGSPFSSPAAKRAKEDFSIKPTIDEEKIEPKPPSTPQPSSPAKPALKGFLAFASATSPFAAVSKTDNAPFGAGTRPSSLFDGAAPKFKSPFPTFTTPKSPNSPNLLKPSALESDPAQDLAKGTNSTPFPASTTPVFGTPSSVGVSTSSKAVFGRSSGFGMSASPSPTPSAAGPTRRAKSPRPQAFGVYGTTAGRFAAPSSKILAKNKAAAEGEESKESDEGTSGEEKGEEDKAKRFSEILAATGSDGETSDGEKVVYTEQETHTGEEEEMTVFHARGKLYEMENGAWKERGPGLFKLNVNRETGQAPRIVMRRDGALNLLVNAKLFKGMAFATGPDPKYVTFTILDENLKPKSHLLRFTTAKIAQDLLDRIQNHIPTE
ncbi:hypothetical protein FRB91_004273 [Serendipita sp. 411]|nr:hypothetical protein FRC15_004998 [Serendipita sp. 397]KAG8842272.1 hypothetical protein FRB91_004273 [Serendipita sp. 411]